LVENDAASDRPLLGPVANHEPVAQERVERLFEAKLAARAGGFGVLAGPSISIKAMRAVISAP
jgi:hypothetical protein